MVTATRHDCAVTIEDLRDLTGESGALPQGELSDAELDGVGGGENLLLAAWNTVVSKLKDVKGGQTGTVEQTRNGIQNQSIRGLRS